MTDPCIHEIDFNQLANDISVIKDSQVRIETRLDTIGDVVFGNGKQGHTTLLARHTDAIKRMWWCVGAVFLALSGLAIRSLI